MVLLRFLIAGFNVAVVAFLIYRMLQVIKLPMKGSRKAVVIAGGIILLLAPVGIFFRFFVPSYQYFIIYPVAIALYLYMIKEI